MTFRLIWSLHSVTQEIKNTICDSSILKGMEHIKTSFFAIFLFTFLFTFFFSVVMMKAPKINNCASKVYVPMLLCFAHFLIKYFAKRLTPLTISENIKALKESDSIYSFVFINRTQMRWIRGFVTLGFCFFLISSVLNLIFLFNHKTWNKQSVYILILAVKIIRLWPFIFFMDFILVLLTLIAFLTRLPLELCVQAQKEIEKEANMATKEFNSHKKKNEDYIGQYLVLQEVDGKKTDSLCFIKKSFLWQILFVPLLLCVLAILFRSNIFFWGWVIAVILLIIVIKYPTNFSALKVPGVLESLGSIKNYVCINSIFMLFIKICFVFFLAPLFNQYIDDEPAFLIGILGFVVNMILVIIALATKNPLSKFLKKHEQNDKNKKEESQQFKRNRRR